MWKAAALAAGLAGFAGGTACAQELAAYQPNSCQKFTASGRTVREAVYLRAACVAARAGVVSPGNGSLSREEMLSILMLMSLRQANPSHSS